MATNNIDNIPQPSQDLIQKGTTTKIDSVWWKWLFKLQAALKVFFPPLGTANQILGVNAAGTANEYKTLTDGNGIDITFTPGVVTITVHQSELTNLWEASLIY